MSAKHSILLIISLLAILTRAQETPCMSLYRPDLMQLWQVQPGSPLCTVSSQGASTYDVGVDAKSGTLYVAHQGQSQPLDYHWRTPTFDLGGDFGVAVYSRGVSGGIILRFTDTVAPGNYSYDWNDGLGAYKRTSYGIRKGDIVKVGAKNTYLVFCILLVTILAALVLGPYLAMYSFVAIFLCLLSFLTTILLGSLVVYNPLLCMLLVIASISFALAISYFLHKNLTAKQLTSIAVASTGALLVYTLVAGYISGAVVVVLILISLCFHGARRDPSWGASMTTCAAVTSLSSNALLAAVCLLNYSPPTIYYTIKTGLRDYVFSTNTYGIYLVIVAAAETILVLIFHITMLCIARSRSPAADADARDPLEENVYA